MVVYLVIGFPDLLDKPGGAPIPGAGLIANTVIGTGNFSGDFVEVKTGPPVQTGWLSKSVLLVKDRETLDEEAFVCECLNAERTIDALPQTKPWFISADYVIARAIFESHDASGNLVNAGNKIPGSDAVGPLQVSSAEWQSFLDNGGTLAAGYGTASVDVYLSQVWAAAFTMFTDAKAITGVKLAAGQGSNTDPPLPNYLEIFLAYLTASPKAAVALAAAAATPADKGQSAAPAGAAGAGAGAAAGAAAGGGGAAGAVSPDSALKLNDFLKTKVSLTDDQIATLFKARPGLTGTNDANAKTVGDFVNAASTALGQGLRAAADLISKVAPETVPATGNAPWFAVAKAEEAKGIKEGNAAGDAEILNYFKSINFQTNTSATPWCAAFVSFCMKNSNNQVAADSVPKTGAALAVTWKGWGNPLPANASDTPQGAVVVLSPTEHQDGSGHVALFMSGDVNTITLLGGNQSNAVQESTYARSRVAAIRWLDVAQPAAAGPGPQGGVAGPQGIPGTGGVLGKLVAAHESGSAGYNAFNRGNAGDSAGQTMNFASMTLAQITQLQALPARDPNHLLAVGKYQIIPSTMLDAIAKLGLTLDTKLTPDLQEAMFRNYLIAIKRPQVKSFITGQGGVTLADAQLALAREFASFPDPSTGLSVYGGVGHNRATVTVAQSASALTTEHASYSAKIAAGVAANQAWIALSA